MSFFRRFGLLGPFFCVVAIGRGQTPPSPGDVLHVESKLVVLDATVLDKAGHVVQQSLTRDDFLIQENKKPQTVYSFEPMSEHVMRGVPGEQDKSPLLIFVLDELNTNFRGSMGNTWNTLEAANEQVYERQQLEAFLKAQPAEMAQRTEVLALTHHGFHVLVRPTRSRDAVLERVQKYNPGLPSPYRDYLEETGGSGGGVADFTLSIKSMEAIWALALQQRSVPGRKHVLWLGYGGPNTFSSQPVNSTHLTEVEKHAREITDLLVDARVTLDVFGPGVGSDLGSANVSDVVNGIQQMVSYRFESDFGFSGFINATGGRWRNGNDVQGEIQTSASYSNVYYTLSYRPSDHDFNGDFRRIRVSVKGHPEWVVLTKVGYYAMPFGGEGSPERQTARALNIATMEAMPFSAINPTLERIQRVKGTDQVLFTFRLDEGDLDWRLAPDSGKREANVALSGAALGPVVREKALATHVATWKLSTPETPGTATVRSMVSVQVEVPLKTKRLRFAVRDLSNGHIGTVDLDPVAIVDAPEIEETVPALQAVESSLNPG